MTKFFYILSLLIICFGNLSLNAKTKIPKYTVPLEYNFSNEEDYIKYEPQILECIDWYLNSSLAFDIDKRANAKQFFVTWLIGSPSVDVVVDALILPFNFDSGSEELLCPFMMGWTKYVLEKKDKADNINSCIEGIRTSIKFYDSNRFFFQDDELIEKFRKMKNKELKKYLSNIPSLSETNNK